MDPLLLRVDEPLLLRVEAPPLLLRVEAPLLALRDVEPVLREVLRDDEPLPLLLRVEAAPLLLRDEPPVLLRADDDELRELLLRRADERDDEAEPGLRSLAGTSSWITARMSPGICFSMNFCIRSSWRRNSFASFTVSLSPS